MEIGSGIAAGTAIVSTAVVVIKAMCLWHDSRKSKSPPVPDDKGCSLHLGILDQIKIAKDQFSEICRDLKAVKKAVLLMARTNPAIDDETLKELVE